MVNVATAEALTWRGDADASAADGVPETAEVLYERFAPQVRRFCERRLRNGADADDATQETLLKAAAALTRVRPGASVWPWLATIAAHECVNVQRADARAWRAAGTDEPVDVEDTVTSRLREQMVRTALAELPPQYRTAFYLREFEGWSYDDIAKMQGGTRASVRTTLMRARRAFNERVRALGTESGWLGAAAAPALAAFRRARARAATWSQSLQSGGIALGEVTSLRAFQAISVGAITATLALGAGTGNAAPAPSSPPRGPQLIAPATIAGGASAARSSPSAAPASTAVAPAPGSATSHGIAIAVSTGTTPAAAAPASTRGAVTSDERHAQLDQAALAEHPTVGEAHMINGAELRCDASATRREACDAAKTVLPRD
jgi:RNA polymerase sigma-70 factor (ECF subfamily)